MILFSKAILRVFSYEEALLEYVAELRCSFLAEVWFQWKSAYVLSCEFAPYFPSLWQHRWRNAFVICKVIIHCYHCFLHKPQIFNIFQLLLIFCNNSYICVSCVHNLKLCFFDNWLWPKQTLFSSFGWATLRSL